MQVGECPSFGMDGRAHRHTHAGRQDITMYTRMCAHTQALAHTLWSENQELLSADSSPLPSTSSWSSFSASLTPRPWS